MWLVSCRKQGILTQGLPPDTKCKLNISSFFALPQPLHCLICAKDIMIFEFLLQMMGDLEVVGWFIYVRVYVRQAGAGGDRR